MQPPIQSPLDPQQQDSLLKLARRYQARDAGVARGACFALSLDVAAAAQRLGMPVVLLRWQVVDDPAFADHWALKFDQTRTLDLTSLQFADHAALLHDVASYPSNFHDRREYPAQLFLDGYHRSGSAPGHRLPPAFMWWVCGRLWLYDTANAWRRRSLGDAASALWRLGHMGAALAVGHLRGAAFRRLETLRSRER